VAVQVARLHALKDHQTALAAVDSARSVIPGLRLLLAGEGDQRSAIEQTIHQRGLEQTVRLAGNRNDVSDLLAAADVFLMSSISEGIPLTVIEAMAAQCPVVSTAVGGVPELIEHGVTGFLAQSGDHAGLAEGLHRLYADPAIRKRIAQRASEKAFRECSLDQMLNSYRAVYRDVLQSGCHRRTPGFNTKSRPSSLTRSGDVS